MARSSRRTIAVVFLRRGPLLVALAGCLAVAVAVPVAWRVRRDQEETARLEAERRRETFDTLNGLATLLIEAREEGLTPPRTDGLAADDSGLDTLVDGLRRQRVERPTTGYQWVHAEGFISGNYVSRFVQYPDIDAWGRGIRYRCPGPVHTHGWDLYSLGPNGGDDAGRADDLDVGAAVPEMRDGRGIR